MATRNFDTNKLFENFQKEKLIDIFEKTPYNFKQVASIQYIEKWSTGSYSFGAGTGMRVCVSNKKEWSKKASWIYVLSFDKRIVKIGKTDDGMGARFSSYSAGTVENRNRGTCSTTNFHIQQSIKMALDKKIEVGIYGFEIILPTFNLTFWKGNSLEVPHDTGKFWERDLMNTYIKLTGKPPILSDNNSK